MDKVCQEMFFGWKLAYERHRGSVRQLESTIRTLDGVRRSAQNDRQLLVEFRSRSQRLQAEMTGEKFNRVRDNLIALTRTAYDNRERHNLCMKTMESRIKESEQKLEASSLEEICLRQVLSQAHAESERLSAAAEDMHKKLQAATNGQNILRVVAHDQKRTINTLSRRLKS